MPTDPEFSVFPEWVPNSVVRYVAHTEQGVPIRELARRDGCHASTVLRQIRRLERKREDPLVDAALKGLQQSREEIVAAAPILAANDEADIPGEAMLRAEGLRVLRRLCETGAVLAVASDMDKAVVVRDGETRTAVVSRQIAQAMALKDWICATQVGRVSRYAITPAGRTALSQMVAEAENCAQGFSESQSGFAPCKSNRGPRGYHHGGRARQVRFNLAESPLAGLARRRDKEGKRFLSDDLVAAGERLREDFELAQMAPKVGKDWERFLRRPCQVSYRADGNVKHTSEEARQRVATALEDLGVGLSDIALRCCCYLEGLEAAEKRLGWSARSGKVVLRIALIRLKAFYHAKAGGAADYIG